MYISIYLFILVGGTQILYEDNLGMIDFYPSDRLGVVYISEAELVTGTGYRKKLAKLRKVVILFFFDFFLFNFLTHTLPIIIELGRSCLCLAAKLL